MVLLWRTAGYLVAYSRERGGMWASTVGGSPFGRGRAEKQDVSALGLRTRAAKKTSPIGGVGLWTGGGKKSDRKSDVGK